MIVWVSHKFRVVVLQLSQLVYLGLFSYFVLVDLQPLDSVTHAAPAVTEWVIWAWTATLFMEQIRKVLYAKHVAKIILNS